MTGPFNRSSTDDNAVRSSSARPSAGGRRILGRQLPDLRQTLNIRRRLADWQRPTFRQVMRRILLSPYYLLRFIVMLPVHLIRFLIKLPRRIWKLWTLAALQLVKARLAVLRGYRGGQEGMRIARVHSPLRRVLAALYFRLQPQRVTHGLGVWWTRLRRGIWQKHPSLAQVQKAMRWGRQYRRHKARFSDIDALRSILYADDEVIESDPLRPYVRTVARKISIKKKWGSFLHSLIRFTEAQRVLELGTGYGLSGLYIAQGMLECYPMRTCMFITLENDTERINKARYNFRRVGYDDFAVIKSGEMADNLAAALRDLKPPDLVLLDGPADGALVQDFFATIQKDSFPGTLVIITNIHRSRSMTKCWRTIKTDTGLAASVDLWHWGILVIGEKDARPVHVWARL